MQDERRPPPLPRRQMLSDGVYESIKEFIMARRISPGAHVNIEQLGRDLQVSPTPVREALARLEADGLVTKEPNRGYFVAPLLDERSVVQLFEVRLLLEPHLASKAAQHASDEHLTALQHSLDQMREVVEAPVDTVRLYRTIIDEDTAFHETIARAALNDLLKDMLLRLRAHLHLYRLKLHEWNLVGVPTIREHEQILAALRARDAAGAAAAAAEHVRRSWERAKRAGAAHQQAGADGARGDAGAH